MIRSLLALLAFAGSLDAQVLSVHFHEEKARKKHGTVMLSGELVLVGEAKAGISVDLEAGLVDWDRNDSVELWVADPKDPSKVPYEWKDGERVGKRSNTTRLQGSDIKAIRALIREDTLAGLAYEYAFRLGRIDTLLEAHKACEKGSEESLRIDGQLLVAYQRLRTWLESTAFPDAVKGLEKDIRKVRTRLDKAGRLDREEAALDSIRTVATPERLLEVAREISDGKHRFKVMESQHIRIVFRDTLSPKYVEGFLAFGERLIESYRREMIDPYLSEDYEDPIPEGIFYEFWYGPDDIKPYERYYEEYYGLGWSAQHKKRYLDSAAVFPTNVHGLTRLTYAKLGAHNDFEGGIAHDLGHALAMLHYGGGDEVPDWLEEAVGYYCSFETIGRNTGTCFQFREARYAEPDPGEEGEKTVQRGMRDMFTALALERGARVDRVAIKTLHEMEDPDFAKAWSFYDFVASTQGEAGQRFLRAHGRTGERLDAWRKESEELFDLEDGDVFDWIDDRWREFAEARRAGGR